MNRLFFADTPLQVVNCVLLAKQLGREHCDEAYLAIHCQFNDYEHLVLWARESHAFARVVAVQQSDYSKSKTQRRRELDILMGLRSPEMCNPELRSLLNDADELYFSCFPPLVQEAYRYLNRDRSEAPVFLYEDGCGTYSGNILLGVFFEGCLPTGGLKNKPTTGLLRRACSLLPRTRGITSFEGMYVKRPDALLYKPEWPVHKLLEINSLGDELLVELSSSVIPPRSVVVLDTVQREAGPEVEKIKTRVFDALTEGGVRLFVRKHPRDTCRDDVPSSAILLCDKQWEALCCRNDLSKCALFGFGSTAMLSPAIESGKFPLLIDLSRVGSGHAINGDNVSALFLKIARGLYRSFEPRVLAPQSDDELSLAIQTVLDFTDDRVSK